MEPRPFAAPRSKPERGSTGLDQILREALPLVDVADTDEILDRERRIKAILKNVASIGREWRDHASKHAIAASRARVLAAQRLEGMLKAVVRVEDYLVAFDQMGSERLGRKPSALLRLTLDAEEQLRELPTTPIFEVIGADRDGLIRRKPGQISPDLLRRLAEARKRGPMPAETIEDLEFFAEIQRLAERQAVDTSDNISFLLQLKAVWHEVRGLRLTLDDALKTRSQSLGRPKDAARVNCASDILHKLHPINLGRRREWPFLRLALASAGFSVPDDPTDFMRAVRRRAKRLIEAFPPPPNQQPVVEAAVKRQPFTAWSHPELFKRPETRDKLLEFALKGGGPTRRKSSRTR